MKRLLIVAVATAAAYLCIIRPRHLTWGATKTEHLRRYAGDELMQNPTLRATRALTINARPESIWPWLVQVGWNRAGWYSYDLLDNLGRPSARTILDAYQNPRPGDTIPLIGETGFTLIAVEAPNTLLIAANPAKPKMVWNMTLVPQPDQSTRLIFRVHYRYSWLTLPFDLLFDFGDFVMMQKMMRGIKQRAESTAPL